MIRLKWKGPDGFGYYYATTLQGLSLNVRCEDKLWFAYVEDDRLGPYQTMDAAKLSAEKEASEREAADVA